MKRTFTTHSISRGVSVTGKEEIMRERYQTLAAIEYAFVVSLIASFTVLGVGALLFGFKPSNWAEWQGVLVGVSATIAGVIGAIFGVRLALGAGAKT
jgi:cytochrome c biogenesis protein CcdA